MEENMTTIRTFGRYPTLGEMRTYYNRDDVLSFLYRECQLRNVHATFQYNKWPIQPKSKADLKEIINDIITNQIEKLFQNVSPQIDTIRALPDFEPVEEAKPGHVILWHGTTEDRVEGITQEGFNSPGTSGGRIWFTRDYHEARRIAIGRARQRQKAPVVFRCEIDLEQYPDFTFKREQYAFRYDQLSNEVLQPAALEMFDYLSFHSNNTITDRASTKVIGFDLVFEADQEGWRRSFDVLIGVIKVLSDFDVCYRLKYSGVRSLHLMIPFEALPESFRGKPILSRQRQVYNNILAYFRRYCGVKRLDRPTVLRLAYMLNEDNGLVNLPITPEELPLFRPWEAHLHNVTIEQPWHGDVPALAPQKTLRFLEEVYRDVQTPKPTRSRKAGLPIAPKPLTLTDESVAELPVAAGSVPPATSVDAWATQLNEEDEMARLAAAWHLMTAKVPVPVEVLRKGLSDPNPDVRWYLAEALQKHLDAEAVHLATQMLSDEDGFVRISATDALTLVPQIGIGENPIEELWEALISRPALLSETSLPIIAGGLMDIHSRIQADNRSKAKSFVEHGIRAIGDFLPSAIANGQPYEHIHQFLTLLTKLCEPDTIEGHPILAEARKRLVEQILWRISQPDADFGYVVMLLEIWKKEAMLLETIRQLGRILEADTVELPASRLTIAEQQRIQPAITAVSTNSSPGQQTRILTAFMIYCSRRLIEVSIKLLLKIGREETAEALTQVVMHRKNRASQQIRHNLMKMLTEIGGKAAVPALIDALSDKNKKISSLAISSLVRIGQPAIFDLLSAIKANKQRLTANAVAALKQIGDVTAVPTLIEWLKEPNADMGVRHAAVEVLSALRHPQVLPTLIEALNDKSPPVARRAAETLRKIDIPSALEAVEDFDQKRMMRSTDLVIDEMATGYDAAKHGEMALIPAGEFQMGSHEGSKVEQPVHTVRLSDFYMDVSPVTVGQYKAFIEATGHSKQDWFDALADDFPVTGVSWYNAMVYAQWAEKRLPTEAEWEYAACGGLEGAIYPWGNDKPSPHHANYGKNVGHVTATRKYPPNGYGLYDMAGNVLEWCLDVYDPNFYAKSPEDNPLAIDEGDVVDGRFTSVRSPRVVRGGWWWSHESHLRVSTRFHCRPRNRSAGFRCVIHLN